LTYLLNADASLLILRATLGTILLAHSLYLKMVVFTLAGTAQYFATIGLPGALAYFVFCIEVAAGVALLLGLHTRLFAALVIPILLGATWAHAANGWLFTNAGGGWEYPLALALMAVVQCGLGGGKYTVRQWLRFDRQQASA
jgi:putative oxidoreductase